MNQARSVEEYVRHLKEMESIAAEAGGTPAGEIVLKGLRSVVRRVEARSEEVFDSVVEESRRFVEAGKFGDGLDALESFPLVLDVHGAIRERLEEKKKGLLDGARSCYEGLVREEEQAVAESRLDDAKKVMVRALEIGVREIVEDAYRRLDRLVRAEDEELRTREEEGLREFERQLREKKEAGDLASALRRRFWEKIQEHRPDSAEDLLTAEKTGDRKDLPGYGDEIRTLEGALSGLHRAYDVAGRRLSSRGGQKVTLQFAGPSGPTVSTLTLKRVDARDLVFEIEGKEVIRPVWSLDAVQLEAFSREPGAEQERSLLLGTSRLLREEYAGAAECFAAAGEAGDGLRGFVESSTAFLEKNAPEFWKRAKEREENRDFAGAHREYSKLVSIPSQRTEALRARAKSSYHAGRYVDAVLDVEALFDAGVIDPGAIDILNQCYDRATLIDSAVRIYEAARKKFPDDGRIVENLVALYLKIHEYDKAQELLKAARRLRDVGPGLQESAGLLAILRKNAFGGKSYWMRAGRYRVETNVSQQRANDLARFLERVYASYAKVFPYRKNETLVFHVKVFRTQGEFETYYQAVNGRSPRQGDGVVSAYYMPMSKELVGWDGDDIEETLRHEGLHQFIDYFVQDCPLWFNEGFASYFEKSTADEARFNPMRHETAKIALFLKKLPSLEALMLMDRREWEANEPVYLYGQSWSFLFYLIRQGRKDLLDAYFSELMAGRTRKEAFDAVFGSGGVNLKELEAK